MKASNGVLSNPEITVQQACLQGRFGTTPAPREASTANSKSLLDIDDIQASALRNAVVPGKVQLRSVPTKWLNSVPAQLKRATSWVVSKKKYMVST